jgi:hypothetical protein
MVLAAHAGNLDCDATVASIFPPGAPPPVELEKIVDENQETTLQSVCCSSCSLRVSPADDSIVCTTAQLKAGGPCCGDGVCNAVETAETCGADCLTADAANAAFDMPGWLDDWLDVDSAGDRDEELAAESASPEQQRWVRPPAPETQMVFYLCFVVMIAPVLVYWVFARYMYMSLHKEVDAHVEARGELQTTVMASPRRAAAATDPFATPRSLSPPPSRTHSGDASQDLKVSVAHLNYWVQLPLSLADQLRGVKPTKKKLLNEICATFTPGKLTAILGATGAGKTTLLNLISHRAKVGEFTGLRMLNGAPTDAKTYQVSKYLAPEYKRKSAMSITRLQCRASTLVNRDACPRPTTQAIMRQQGYVMQTAENFYEDMTVYDTILSAPSRGG